MTWSFAAEVSEGDGVEVIHEVDTTWHFGYKGVNLYGREMHRIDIAYPSMDAHGRPARLSGSIVIPASIYRGEAPADGVLLYNRYTQLQTKCCPTAGFVEGEMLFMCTPLEPNWILVESDFYGFGVTASHVADQYYVYGDANGRASVDCLLAAQQLLGQRGIDQGKYVLNAGMSSGGYDCLATQRVRDLYYRDRVHFDKTLAAAAPFDVVEAYDRYLDRKDDADLNCVLALMVVNAFNRHDSLGYSNDQLFSPVLAQHFDEWVTSGRYSTNDVNDSLRKYQLNTLADCLQPAFLNPRSDEYRAARAAMRAHELKKDWTPDTTQSYFYQHYAHDSWVPCSSGRPFLDFLTATGAYRKSLVPELTRLTTCMFLMSDSHHLSGIHHLLWLGAVMAAYPVLYYDGELNTHYYDLVKVGTPMGIVRRLEDRGIDVGAALSALTGTGGGSAPMDFFGLIAALGQFNETLQQHGTDLTEVLRIADDSGLSMGDIAEILQYLNKKKAPTTARRQAPTADDAPTEAEHALPGNLYYSYLMRWLSENQVDLNELKIGE